MKISTRGRYALRMMLDIAQNQDSGYVTLKDIAARQNVSKKYLEQIAILLSQADMLRANRGHQGGYKLAEAAGHYTVGAILRVTEGSLALVACLDEQPNACPRRGECLTLPMWEGLEQTVAGYLDGITLEDILERRIPPVRTVQRGTAGL